MSTGIIFDIKRYAIHDGPGIRTTVFLKGCPLRCLWCHNPEGQSLQPEPIIGNTMASASAGTLEYETAGHVVSVGSVIEEIEKDILFFDESGGGVTISGGEPLMQPAFLKAILTACKERDIHTAIDTCGYASHEALDSIMDKVDLFLFDLKLMDENEHARYTGQSNRLILDNLREIVMRRKQVIIRFPVVPGITDTDENVSRLADLLSSLNTITCVSLLPYHKMAGSKYVKLRRPNDIERFEPPSREKLDSIKARLERRDLRVTVGG
jgi:pyruvate formate lyase activating enzyme